MKRFIALLLVIMMIASLCACGKSATTNTTEAAEATEAPTATLSPSTAEEANTQAQQAVADEHNEAGALIGTVSQLSTGKSLVVEAGGNVYVFDVPVDTDTKNMVASNSVTVYFEGTLDPTIGTSFQDVEISKIEFGALPEIVQVGPTQAPATVSASTSASTSTSQSAAATDSSTQVATQTATGEALVYMWSDGTIHDAPEDGTSYITAAQVAKIQFEEPTQYQGLPLNACNCTIMGFVEDNKYMLVDDGAGHQYLFYVEGKQNRSYDGTGMVVGANCTVMYAGTLNPNYGADSPQYVYVDNIQTDSKAYYYSIISPKATSTPKPNGMWYGTDGKLHWYGSDGKVYNYDKNGNVVLS